MGNLKPCPMCGCKPRQMINHSRVRGAEGAHLIICEKEKGGSSHALLAWHKDFAETVELWNDLVNQGKGGSN